MLLNSDLIKSRWHQIVAIWAESNTNVNEIYVLYNFVSKKSAANWSLIKREPHCIIAAGLDFLKASQIWSLSFPPHQQIKLQVCNIVHILSQKLPNMIPFFFETPKYFVEIFRSTIQVLFSRLNFFIQSLFVSFIWRIFGSLVVSLRNASHGDEIKRSRWACSKLAPGPTG